MSIAGYRDTAQFLLLLAKDMELTNTHFAGILIAGFFILLAKRRWSRMGDESAQKRLYRSDHGVLNVQLPPQSMWMNMGFWKDTYNFPQACRALLEEVLRSARILEEKSTLVRDDYNAGKSMAIIDLGFGCGDQTLHIKDSFDSQNNTSREHPSRMFLSSYVGLTLESSHFDIAQERLMLSEKTANTAFKIYCIDASKPENWTSDIQNSISLACQTNEMHENWLLGLDTLYHFRPSRWPVIEYARRELGASLMAFDLCLAENLSIWHRISLKLMAFFGQSPFANWVTIEGYRERLVVAGYAREQIEIRDISDHVFRPLADHLKRREEKMKRYGMSIGRFRYAGKMFGWWGRTGVVRGCIVIARR